MFDTFEMNQQMSLPEKFVLYFVPAIGACCSVLEIMFLLKKEHDGHFVGYHKWLHSCSELLVWVSFLIFSCQLLKSLMHLISCDLNLHLYLYVGKYHSLHKVCKQSLHSLQPYLMFLVDSEANIGDFPFDNEISIVGGAIFYFIFK